MTGYARPVPSSTWWWTGAGCTLHGYTLPRHPPCTTVMQQQATWYTERSPPAIGGLRGHDTSND